MEILPIEHPDLLLGEKGRSHDFKNTISKLYISKSS